MRFGIFYEHQLPRPWAPDGEHVLLKQSLDQIELADRLGYHYAWEVEHHFLEEYSHSSAPEVFLAAASQRTTDIRLGHGIIQTAPQYNHPARTAERGARAAAAGCRPEPPSPARGATSGSAPPRSGAPKPAQNPPPPLWVACS